MFAFQSAAEADVMKHLTNTWWVATVIAAVRNVKIAAGIMRLFAWNQVCHLKSYTRQSSLCIFPLSVEHSMCSLLFTL